MFFIFIFIFFNSFAEIKGLEIKPQYEKKSTEESVKSYKIKKLPPKKKERLIVNADYYFRTPNILQDGNIELQNTKKDGLIISMQCTENCNPQPQQTKNTTSTKVLSLNNDTNTDTFFDGLCNVYRENKLANYKLQIEVMSLFIKNIFNTATPETFLPQDNPHEFLVNNIKQAGEGRLASKIYTCRGFSKVMLLEEESGTEQEIQEANVAYIKGAKSDIKSAMHINEMETVETIDLIPDVMLTNIFNKYNQIATKGLTKEQLALIGHSIKTSELVSLQSQIQENYDMMSEHANANRTLQEKEKADLSPYYDSNPLNLLNSIKDANGDETQQTQTLRDFRATKEQGKQTEQRLDEMLDTILQLQKDGDIK